MKTIHHFAASTGEYLSTGEADPSPLEPGVFLLPAHATTLTPPKARKGMAVVFADGKWQQVEDHRGETIFSTADGMPAIQATLGPVAEGYTTTARPSAVHVWQGGAWTVDPDLHAAARRAERDALLAASDWTQLPDNPLGTDARSAWRDYRQALRDLDMAGDDWPTPPG